MNYPIIKFKNYEQAMEYLDKWKKILSLQNWIIDIELSNEQTESPNWGSSVNWKAIRIAKITIPTVVDSNKFVAKYCQELILVHELLHILMLPCDSENETVRAEWHAQLEQMAKGYIMSKYELNFSWFENDI